MSWGGVGIFNFFVIVRLVWILVKGRSGKGLFFGVEEFLICFVFIGIKCLLYLFI